MDTTVLEWLSVIVVVAVFGAAMYWLIALVPKARLMRCPETGAVVFVEAGPAATPAGNRVTVKQCEFWPGRKECAQGCLARYSETHSGYRVNVEALRPFEPR